MTPKFSNKQKMDCARREVRYRRRVYPRLVARGDGELTQKEADREIDMMQEIAEDYRLMDEPKLV